MKKISVVTCTFNRAELLERLYDSLLKQTNNDFKWIIIDDGSTDGTEKKINIYKNENLIDIEYYKTANGGKHRALNIAIEVCNTKLFFIVDSDDFLSDNAIEKIICFEESITEKEKFCGVAGLKATFENKVLAILPEVEYLDATSIEATYKYNLVGDKAEVFYTNILKNYKFPTFEGEKFLTEAIVWNNLANDGYKIRWFNEIIYRCEYREEGLSNNSFKLFLKNPIGKAYYHNQESSFMIPIKLKIMHQANYIRYGLLGKKKLTILFNESRYKRVLPISIPISIIMIIYTKLRTSMRSN